mgnify:CR=1 FL=1
MKVSFLFDVPASPEGKYSIGSFTDAPDFTIHLKGDEFEFMAWGDPIYNDQFCKDIIADPNPGFITENLSGHYYFILNDLKTGETQIGSSLFSILPVYYCNLGRRILVSDNVFEIALHAGLNSPSPGFILESLLFNYPLSNQSLVEGISLLDSNSVLVTGTNGFRIVRHTEPGKWFSRNPASWKDSTGRMTDVFLNETEKYLPRDHYITALTGGFDGRTLTAAGLYHNRDFSCYCMGTGLSGDLGIASEVSSSAGIRFHPVLLDSEYISNRSLDAGKEFIINSSGTGTFSRAHYIHSASVLGSMTSFVISGNFGSEVLRTAHSPGVMIAPAIYRIFSSATPGEAIEAVRKDPVLQLINPEIVKRGIGCLEENIERLPCFDRRYETLDRNMQFYIFILEETFRKYFGSEIKAQFGYLALRTPFLDSNFLKELFSTALAGIHSGYMENNPLRRYKGQALYASIIRKAAPQLGRYNTDKGYSPEDLLTPAGRFRVIKGYLGKKIFVKGVPSSDPLAVREAWHVNRNFYESVPLSDSLFNEKKVKRMPDASFGNEKVRLYSLIYALNYLLNLK